MADLILSALFNAGSEIYRRWNGRKLVNEKLRYLLQSVEEAQARIMFWKKTLQNADTEETGLRMMEDYNLKNKFENLITALQNADNFYSNIKEREKSWFKVDRNLDQINNHHTAISQCNFLLTDQVVDGLVDEVARANHRIKLVEQQQELFREQMKEQREQMDYDNNIRNLRQLLRSGWYDDALNMADDLGDNSIQIQKLKCEAMIGKIQVDPTGILHIGLNEVLSYYDKRIKSAESQLHKSDWIIDKVGVLLYCDQTINAYNMLFDDSGNLKITGCSNYSLLYIRCAWVLLKWYDDEIGSMVKARTYLEKVSYASKQASSNNLCYPEYLMVKGMYRDNGGKKVDEKWKDRRTDIISKLTRSYEAFCAMFSKSYLYSKYCLDLLNRKTTQSCQGLAIKLSEFGCSNDQALDGVASCNIM